MKCYRAFIFTVIITCWQCCRTQDSLTQPSSVMVSLGQNAEIPCTGSIKSNALFWYQKKPGKSPQYLGYENNRASGIPNRFSLTKDRLTKTGKLTISGVQAEDDANYYCNTWISGSNVHIFGQGTKMIVKTSSPKAPSISLLPPSNDELTSKGTATLACLIGGHYPPTATVAWKGDKNAITSGVQNSEVKADGATDYIMSSYVTLSAAEWKKYDTISCEVSHESKLITESLVRSECLP